MRKKRLWGNVALSCKLVNNLAGNMFSAKCMRVVGFKRINLNFLIGLSLHIKHRPSTESLLPTTQMKTYNDFFNFFKFILIFY